MVDDKVLEFKPKTDVSLRVDREFTRECSHNHVTIRQRPRRLRCRDCKTDIDPFEYLLGCAENWERLFPKNEAARRLEIALDSTLKAHGSVLITESGITAKCLTEAGAKLEAHESWGVHAWNGGAAAAIIAAVEKLEQDAARWGHRDLQYPRMTIERIRGQRKWRVGCLSRNGWRLVADGVESLNAAYDAAKAEADRLEKPFIREDRPRRLWK